MIDFHPRALIDDRNQKHKHQRLSFQGSGVDGRLCSGVYRGYAEVRGKRTAILIAQGPS